MTQAPAQPRYHGDLSVLDNQQLVHYAREFMQPGSSIFPLSIAAEILKRVADAAESADVPEGIDPFLIAVAIRRIVSNYEPGQGYTMWMNAFLAGLVCNPNVPAVASV